MPKNKETPKQPVCEWHLKSPHLVYRLIPSSSMSSGFDLQVLDYAGNGRSLRIDDKDSLIRLKSFCDKAIHLL